MQKIRLPFSKKDIPIPSKLQHQKRMVHHTERFINKIGWHIHHTLYPKDDGDKETWGFKSGNPPPSYVTDLILKNFNADMFALCADLEFRNNHGNRFQREISSKLREITQKNKVIVGADKKGNDYLMEPRDYLAVLQKNICDDYRKVDPTVLSRVNNQAGVIVEKMELSERMETHTEQEAFFIWKDHKEGFDSKDLVNKPARLINPAKTDLGKVSRQILQRVNQNIRDKTGYNQWTSTGEVLRWFRETDNKRSRRWLKFDIKSFYPNITRELLENAIKWAKKQCGFEEDEIEIVMFCRKTFLFFQNAVWVKKENPSFDVPMGSNDGAEVSELCGLYLLSLICSDRELRRLGVSYTDVGLYRDDGLMMLNSNKRNLDKIRQRLEQLFREQHLEITVQHGMQSADFLDVRMHLTSSEHEPYRKDDIPPRYINIDSDHPPVIKKRLPDMIGKRVSGLCSSEEKFDQHKGFYEESLKSSGYNKSLAYQPPIQVPQQRKRKRWAKMFWYNPPWSMSVRTNVERKFLHLIDKHFKKGVIQRTVGLPPGAKEGVEWARHFNRHTCRVSYSCHKNLGSKLAAQNSRVLNGGVDNDGGCNCRVPGMCPLNGNCQTRSVVYTGMMESDNPNPMRASPVVHCYRGSTEGTFKQRYNGHKFNLEHRESNHTTLSAKHWQLVDENLNPRISWKISHKAHAYQPGKTCGCDLCLTEKVVILLGHDGPEKIPRSTILLNRRTELLQKCRHMRKFTYAGFKTRKWDYESPGNPTGTEEEIQ